jgi:hypothetical protein
MLAMIESFVDLTYRGLQLGRRIKLTQVRPTTAYLEVPTPMPVGTAIAILTDDTVALEAMVIEIHEQVGGSDRPPGMVVKPKLEDKAAKKWWQDRVALPELDKKQVPATPQPPVVATVMPKRPSRDTQVYSAVPEAVEGQDTAVMEAVDPSADRSADPSAQPPAEPTIDPLVADPPARLSNPNLQDDGKSTTMMDAVDLAALGLDPASSSGRMPAVTTGQMAAVEVDDDEPDPAASNGDKKPNGGGTKKKRKKR